MTIQQPVLAYDIRFISLSGIILFRINSEVLILADYIRSTI